VLKGNGCHGSKRNLFFHQGRPVPTPPGGTPPEAHAVLLYPPLVGPLFLMTENVPCGNRNARNVIKILLTRNVFPYTSS